MAQLSDDLILQIVSILPLKVSIQCKCLNKMFEILISDPAFEYKLAMRSSKSIDYVLYYSIYYNGKSIYKIPLQSHGINDKKMALEKYSQGPTLPTILSSYGGLLLLKFGIKSLVVFNPTTGAYRLIPFIDAICISFAYQLTYPSAFKLISISEAQSYYPQRFYKFKIFECDANSWRKSSTRCPSNGIRFVQDQQAVYIDDCLHWLKQDGEIFVFNVKNELLKVIRKPDINLGDYPSIRFSFQSCLGSSQDHIIMATSNGNDICIYAYDSIQSEWKIEKSIPLPENSNPIYYDDNVLIYRTGSMKKEIFVYEVAPNSWRKIGSFPDWSSSNQIIRTFFKTSMKIPGSSYLREMKKERLISLPVLFRLQKFIQ